MDQPTGPIKPSQSYARASLVIYIVSCLGAAYALYCCPREQMAIVIPIALGIFAQGGQKAISAYQNHATDKKVGEDLATTRTVATALNGGFDDRVKEIVRGVLSAELPAALAKALAKHDVLPMPPKEK